MPSFRLEHITARALQVLNPCVSRLVCIARKGQNFDVSRAAIQTLGRLRDWSTVDALIELLGEPILASDSAVALATIGDLRAVKPLVETVEQGREGLDGGAIIRALGGFHTRDTMVELITFLMKSTEELRVQAALTLRAFVDRPEARDALLESLEDHSRRVVVSSLLALKGVDRPDVGHQIIETFESSSDDHVRATVLSSLQGCITVKKHALELVRTASRDRDSRVRANAVELVGCLSVEHDEARQVLSLFDRDDDNRVQGNLAVVWGRVDPRRSLELLQGMMSSSDAAIRASAVHGGRFVKDEQVILWLLRVLREDDEDIVLRNALESLGEHQAPLVVDGLVSLLHHRAGFVRAGAARALGSMRAQQHAGEVVKLFERDQDVAVRTEVIKALGAMGALEWAGFLTDLVRTAEPFLQKAAIESLDQLGRIETIPALVPCLRSQDETVRAAAAVALWHQGMLTIVDSLAAMLDSSDMRWQSSAMQALRILGDELPGLATDASSLHLCSALQGGSSEMDSGASLAADDSEPIPVDEDEWVPLSLIISIVDSLVRGDVDEAASHARLRAAQPVVEGQVPWSYVVGLAASRAGREQQAAEDWSRAIGEVEEFFPAAVDAASVRQSSGDAQGSLTLYALALRAKMKLVQQVVEVLESLVDEDHLVEASTLLRELLTLEPLERSHLGRLGVALLKAGKYGEARRILVQAFVTEPENRSVQFNLALASYRLGRHHESLSLCERILAEAPHDSSVALRADKLLSVVKRAESSVSHGADR